MVIERPLWFSAMMIRLRLGHSRLKLKNEIERDWTGLIEIERDWTRLNAIERDWKGLNAIERDWTRLKAIEGDWRWLNAIERDWTRLNNIEWDWTSTCTILKNFISLWRSTNEWLCQADSLIIVEIFSLNRNYYMSRTLQVDF